MADGEVLQVGPAEDDIVDDDDDDDDSGPRDRKQEGQRFGVHFGVRNDSFITGYISGKELQRSPFDQLLMGRIWLVRRGVVYVSRFLADAGLKSEEISRITDRVQPSQSVIG